MIAEAISVRVSVARLKTTLILVLDELILMFLQAIYVSHMVALFYVLLQIGLQELFRVHFSHIIDIVGASSSLVTRRCVNRGCYHLSFRALMLNRMIHVTSGDIPTGR